MPRTSVIPMPTKREMIWEIAFSIFGLIFCLGLAFTLSVLLYRKGSSWNFPAIIFSMIISSVVAHYVVQGLSWFLPYQFRRSILIQQIRSRELPLDAVAFPPQRDLLPYRDGEGIPVTLYYDLNGEAMKAILNDWDIGWLINPIVGPPTVQFKRATFLLGTLSSGGSSLMKELTPEPKRPVIIRCTKEFMDQNRPRM